MATFEERLNKWKARKWHQKAGDIVFWVFLILLLIPGPRKTIATTMNKVFLTVRKPSATDAEKAYQLTSDEMEWNLLYADGSAVNKKNYTNEVVFLNFWGTYCPPCIAEMPEIQSLYDDYKDKVKFILVSGESPSKVKEFLNNNNYELPDFYGGNKLPAPLAVRSVPTTYIISKEGKIMLKKIGAADWNSKNVRELLDRLLAE